MNSAVIVRFDERGDIHYHVIGDDVRLFIVDERCPHDRVFEITRRDSAETFREVIPEGSVIGHNQDDRHEAVMHRVLQAMDGEKHLSAVSTHHTPDGKGE